MADYEKECFMVQGFSSSSAATPGSTHSEYVQEAQQGTLSSRISSLNQPTIPLRCCLRCF